MRVAIIGCGRVGLVTGCCLASLQHDVICVDKSPEKIDKLQRGLLPLYEPYLETVMKRAQEQGQLTFRSDAAEAICAADLVFLCWVFAGMRMAIPTCLLWRVSRV